MKTFFGTILRMAVISLLISLVLTLANWPFYRGDDFRFGFRFLSGAAAIFVIWSVASLVSAAAEQAKFKKDPGYKHMKESTGIRWKDYKGLKQN